MGQITFFSLSDSMFQYSMLISFNYECKLIKEIFDFIIQGNHYHAADVTRRVSFYFLFYRS